MTHKRDIESLLDLWLGEGSTVAPDRIIDVVTDRIEGHRQRSAWRIPTPEFPMPASLRIAAGVAALAILGAGAFFLVGRSSPPGVGSQSPGTSASPSASLSSSTLPSPSPYVLPSTVPNQIPQTISWTSSRPWIHLDLPSGWTYTDWEQGFSLRVGPDSHPAGGITFRPNPVLGMAADSCPGPAAEGVGTSVTAIVAAIIADPRFTVVPGPATTLDGRPAQVLDVELAPGYTGTCGEQALLFRAPGSFIGLEGNERLRVVLLDVGGIVLAVVVFPAEEAFDAFVARAMPVIQTVVFEP